MSGLFIMERWSSLKNTMAAGGKPAVGIIGGDLGECGSDGREENKRFRL